ncbi:L,D-transpeptidase family protein [Primorskyibacter sp. 2E107]|uniref:L,D-transpeptidase family protein n=1 Tax=Primorskyibacter sp. 2E107 TaxID=3403458 RepID=UPI003AF5BBB1
MQFLKFGLVLALLLGLGACSSKFKSYDGPEVTHVHVSKGERRMYLLHHGTVLKTYKVGLGNQPRGDKKFRGDGKTPEGDYHIDRRNPNSRFHLSIGISYPNAEDIAEAAAMGKNPGGDIFIHGRPREFRKGGRDWTAGCIAVKDREMEMIYAMVRDGTPIRITP